MAVCVLEEALYSRIADAMAAWGRQVVRAECDGLTVRAARSDFGDLLLTVREGDELAGGWAWADDRGWVPTLVDSAMNASILEVAMAVRGASWRPL